MGSPVAAVLAGAIAKMQDETLTLSVLQSALKIHDSLDAREVVARALELLPMAVDAESWAIFMKVPNAERLDLVRATNASVVPLSAVIDLTKPDGPVARSAKELKTVLTDGGPEVAGRGDDPAEPNLSLSIPLVVEGRLVGAAQAQRTPGSRSGFTDTEVRLAELVCESVARALANAVDYANATTQSLVDDLTRLYNVRYLYQALEGEIRRAKRYGSPISVVFMDLDGFKQVNDAYGHRVGSDTLAEVARVILSAVRESDFVARYGGDEFVLLLPETAAGSALQTAERVRARISEQVFDGGIGATIRLTASFGVSSFPEHAIEVGKLIELADKAMYAAKQRSKNSVRLASP